MNKFLVIKIGVICFITQNSAITKFERKRQAKNDLLSMHCIERTACMRQGNNMIG